MKEVVLSIHDIMPRAAMPMVVAGEVKNAGACNIECDIEIVGGLIKEMAGVSAFVAAATVVSAPHVGADANALLWPKVPLAIGVEADRNSGDVAGERGSDRESYRKH